MIRIEERTINCIRACAGISDEALAAGLTVLKLVSMLQFVEWTNHGGEACPACYAVRWNGHRADCDLAAMLATTRLGAAEQEAHDAPR